MIVDKIENAHLYKGLSSRLAKGFEYIQNTDLSSTECGIYEIEEKAVFAIVQEYDTKAEADSVLENHFKYIDIQYIISGAELMGVTHPKGQKVVEVNKEKDYTFYEGETTYIPLEAGMFTVFFPDDLHRPGVQNGNSSRVKKVVVKVQQ